MNGPIIRRLAFVAAAEAGLARRELFSNPRPARRVSHVRFAVMRVARERGKSFSQIARQLGLKDHSSACHGYCRAPQIAAADASYAALLNRLREEAGR